MLPETLKFIVDVFEDKVPAEISRDKKKVAKHIIEMIRRAEDPMYTLEFEEEEELQEEDRFGDEEERDRWDPAAEYIADNPNKVQFGTRWIDCEDVVAAVMAYGEKRIRGTGGKRDTINRRPTLATMRREFPFITKESHLKKLRMFEKKGQVEPEKANAIRFVSTKLFEAVQEEMAKGNPLHDEDLRDMAVDIMRKDSVEFDFTFSPSWINSWKRKHRISSRKITKFVSRRNHRNRDELEKAADEFVLEAKQKMNNYPPHAVINCDQSGVQLELFTNRTLASTGSKKVEIVAHSVSSTTHSYTIMPVFASDGTLYDKLFIVMKETNGRFPQRGHFMASNLVARAHTSHIMTKALMLDFLKECIFTNGLPDWILMIVDSWPAWRAMDDINGITPANKHLEILTIPAGCTGMIQPSDVGYFGNFKKAVKKVRSIGCRVAPDHVPGQRDNIFKMVSLLHWQFCAPSMKPWLRHAWKRYTGAPSTPFQTGYEQMFPKDVARNCNEAGCMHTSNIYCVYCKSYFCFRCFFVSYHKCC